MKLSINKKLTETYQLLNSAFAKCLQDGDYTGDILLSRGNEDFYKI